MSIQLLGTVELRQVGIVLKLKSQFVLRFGATFNESYENLIYELTAVDAFNQDLVKGVVADIEMFEDGADEYIKLLSYGEKVG